MKKTSNSPKVKTHRVQGHSLQESLTGSHETAKPGRPTLKIQKILVPTDFSDFSKKALKYAVSVAKQLGAKITLLHVIELPIAYPEGGYYPFIVEPDRIVSAARATADKFCKVEHI